MWDWISKSKIFKLRLSLGLLRAFRKISCMLRSKIDVWQISTLNLKKQVRVFVKLKVKLLKILLDYEVSFNYTPEVSSLF